MASGIQVIDNFLPDSIFSNIKRETMNASWVYSDIVEYFDEPEETFQFGHWIYSWDEPVSELYEVYMPIFFKLKAIKLKKVKVNLLLKTPEIVRHSLHTDMMEDDDLKDYITSILYINTNNGYTWFEDGTIVNSVANRMLLFPSNYKHAGTTCTDEKIRIVANFNFKTKYNYNS